jgi:hypothetical protein
MGSIVAAGALTAGTCYAYLTMYERRAWASGVLLFAALSHVFAGYAILLEAWS